MPKQKDLELSHTTSSMPGAIVSKPNDPRTFFVDMDGELKLMVLNHMPVLDGYRYWRHKEKGTGYEIVCVGNATATKREPGSDFEHVYVSYRNISSTDIYTTTETAFLKRMEPVE